MCEERGWPVFLVMAGVPLSASDGPRFCTRKTLLPGTLFQLLLPGPRKGQLGSSGALIVSPGNELKREGMWLSFRARAGLFLVYLFQAVSEG